MHTRLLYFSILLIIAGAMVTFLTGESRELHLRQGESTSDELPFILKLDEFRIEYYPESEMPMDYVSEVTILPEALKRTISMNHILKWKGYRFYQADYDPDLQGSILSVNHDPWGVTLVYGGYLLLLAYMLGWFVRKDDGFRQVSRPVSRKAKKLILWIGLILLIGFFFMICRKLVFRPLMPVLRSPLLWIHVLSVMLSYSIFALIAISGILGLVTKSESTRGLLRNSILTILYPAVFLQAFGIIVGSVWANISWGNYWSWDPKETWALITFLVYFVALSANKAKPFSRPKFFFWYAALAFLSVIITYFGVNYIFGGVHAYA